MLNSLSKLIHRSNLISRPLRSKSASNLHAPRRNPLLLPSQAKLLQNISIVSTVRIHQTLRFFSSSPEQPKAQNTPPDSHVDSENVEDPAAGTTHKTISDVPREEQTARDPWKVTSGKWYSPELKRRATAIAIAERDAALPKHVCSTPSSLPWPSTEREHQVLEEIREKMAISSPMEFASSIEPYWNATLYYHERLVPNYTRNLTQLPIKEPQGSLLLPSFSSLQLANPHPTPDSDLATLYVLVGLIDLPTLVTGKESDRDRLKFSTSSPEPSLSLDAVRLLSEASKDALKLVLPAMVEADVYYAAETLNQILKKKGPVTLAETINENLNPAQITNLLPAMCRVNPKWREDGFFDLMVEVLSTGHGVLRWEPADVAKVISELPKVPIATDYYTSPEFDPTHPDNAEKNHAELLQVAQQMANAKTASSSSSPTTQPNIDPIHRIEAAGSSRWDHHYGFPGDFLLPPSKDDIEAAKREYEEVLRDFEAFTETPSSSSGNSFDFKSTESKQANLEEDDILNYLDVSHSVSPQEVQSSPVNQEPVYYNPIAWQPEEIGRLIGTMLSQELELDDIVNVLTHLATEGWKDAAPGTPWHAYMGYFAAVASDALATNNHWVDEDYSWVLHDVIAKVGPWALRQWPDYRTDEHEKWLAELVAQTAIKYGRFKHDYRLIQILLNMLCDQWPEFEQQKLSDMIEVRMKDRTYVGRAQNWFKWRVAGTLKERFSDRRAAQSRLWIAPYDAGENPKLPDLVKPQGLRELKGLDKWKRALSITDDQLLNAPSRTGTTPHNTVNW